MSDNSDRPNPYKAILVAMIPTRHTWRQDVKDYSKIITLGLFLWALVYALMLVA